MFQTGVANRILRLQLFDRVGETARRDVTSPTGSRAGMHCDHLRRPRYGSFRFVLGPLEFVCAFSPSACPPAALLFANTRRAASSSGLTLSARISFPATRRRIGPPRRSTSFTASQIRTSTACARFITREKSGHYFNTYHTTGLAGSCVCVFVLRLPRCEKTRQTRYKFDP